MNCKLGDLAIIVNSPKDQTDFLGAIVRLKNFYVNVVNNQPTWIFENSVRSGTGRMACGAEDQYLKPLDAPLNDDEIINERELICTD